MPHIAFLHTGSAGSSTGISSCKVDSVKFLLFIALCATHAEGHAHHDAGSQKILTLSALGFGELPALGYIDGFCCCPQACS